MEPHRLQPEDIEHPAVPWNDYAPRLLTSWQSLLATEPEEHDVQAFLESHPALLPGAIGDIGPGGNHGPHLDGVFRQAPLQGLSKDRYPDFMWITRSTSRITPICFEIEKPGKHWFTTGERPTAELTQALDQLTDWKVWFSESENQSIFRKVYLLGEYEHRALEPEYILIFGRQREFDVAYGRHKRAERLRKKRDFMRRRDETFMTFDALAPDPRLADMVTLSMTSDGPELAAVPPTFTTGPGTAALAEVVRDPQSAVEGVSYWDEARKAYVIDRWRHWQEVADQQRNR
jgi:hypothetical protein